MTVTLVVIFGHLGRPGGLGVPTAGHQRCNFKVY
jgi:hypothetical protein